MQHPTRSILRIVPLALAALPLLVEAAPAAEEPHAAVREDKWDVLYLGDQRIGYARSTTSDVTENGRKITRTTTENINGCCGALSSAARSSKSPRVSSAATTCNSLNEMVKKGNTTRAAALAQVRAFAGPDTPAACR